MTASDVSFISAQHSVNGRDVPWLFEQWVRKSPDKSFLVWEPFEGAPESWSYARFWQTVHSVAGGLHERGVKHGDKVLIHLDNCPEFLMSWLACSLLGAVAVTTNTRSVARDVRYFAEHTQAVAAITQPCYAELIRECAPSIQFMAVTNTDAGTKSEPVTVGHISFSELLNSTSKVPPRQTDPHADLSIQFTSGTTSRPKAVLWTHANAIWGAQRNASHLHLRHVDTALVVMPLFHANAQSFSLLGSLWVGGTIVLQPKFSASRFWDVSLRNKITWCSFIYFCVQALFKHPIPEKHHYWLWGLGVNIPEIDEMFGLTTLGYWGMTEIITHGIIGDLHHPGPHSYIRDRPSGHNISIGRCAPGYEISIRRDDGSEIGPGERGDLFIKGVRGISLFKEYYKDPEATEKSFDADGWLNTGDIIAMDEEGNLYFGDRKKDMLRVGGENVAASEIESVILETALVKECAVVGQPHYMLDEVPVAFVIPATDDADIAKSIVAACKKNLPDFKVVRDVHIVASMPRATLEKIDKNALRERLSEITE